MSGLLLFCFVGCVALVSAAEEPLPAPEMDPVHHVTTVCIQVHGSSALCGPMVKPEAARGASLQMAPAAEASRASQFQAVQLRDAMTGGPPSDAVLQGYYENVPVYRMRSAEEIQRAKGDPPCPEPASRSAGPIVSVVQPPTYGLQTPLIGGLGGLGNLGGIRTLGTPGSVVTVQQPLQGYMRGADPRPTVRTIPFAPFGVDQQPQQQQAQQQMRAAQFARSQPYAAMRSRPMTTADCDDSQQFQPQMRGGSASSLQGQQQMRQAYPPPPQDYASLRESQQSAEFLAKQCADQEEELKKKSDEITDLKKQLDRLSSMSEKTTIEQKTVSVKSSSSSESQKETTDDAKPKDPQSSKKKK